MNLSVPWRNLWRNRQRSAISISALTMGTIALVFVHALWTGFANDVINNVTQGGEGEVKAHASGYLQDRSIYKAVEQTDGLLRAAQEHGVDAALRSIGYGLIAHGAKAAGVQLVGVDPVSERTVSTLPARVRDGRFLGDSAERGLVVGFRLAQSVDARVGDELVVVVQAADGSTSSELFHLGGILEPVGESIDRSGVYMHRDELEMLFSMGGRVHEVVFNSHGRLDPDQIVSLLAPAAGSVSVKTWRELNPAASSMVEVILAMISIIQTFFYLTAGLGVMNTMLMATFERTAEFGLMKALGCPTTKIVGEVATEAWLLGIVGCVMGAIAGSQLVMYFGTHGIDAGKLIGSFSAGGLVFNNVWHPVLQAKAVSSAVGMMCLVVVLAAIYPAIKAARTDPARAMSHV